jgi:chromosomal replication initiator protein
MQAVGRALCDVSNRATPRVEYLTAEEFATRLIAALKAREVDRFKARYRDVDVLLLEDVHFLQGKERMQDEVLATVKALKSRGSRVVLSSSFAARDLKNLDTQLVSRFCSGFLAHIDKPGFETRRRILCEKARLHQVMLPDNVTDLLADRIRTDVRQIESCLHNLVLKAKLLNRQISMEMAWEVLGHYAQQEVVMDFEGIVRKVCEGFGISPKQLNSRSRKREYVVARNSVFYLARKHTDLSLKEIGDRFSRRHSTVLKGITSIEREMSRETPLGRQVTNTLSLIERNGRITYP